MLTKANWLGGLAAIASALTISAALAQDKPAAEAPKLLAAVEDAVRQVS